MLENLMGKIVYWCNGNYNRTGAVKAIAGDALLIQFDCMTGEKTDWSWPMELVCMEEITMPTGRREMTTATKPSIGYGAFSIAARHWKNTRPISTNPAHITSLSSNLQRIARSELQEAA